LAGDVVRNAVWRSLFGNECQLVIKDFDIAFFDALGDRSQELTAKATLTAQFLTTSLMLKIKRVLLVGVLH
jgi:hypothetical protein